MAAIVYIISSFIIMIVTMIFTKSSPSVFLDIIGSVISSFFPFADYIQMSTEEANVSLIYLWILSEWFISYINSFLEDNERKLFVWGGNTFIVLSITMLSDALDDYMAGDLIGFLVLLFIGYIAIVVFYCLVCRKINMSTIGFMLKLVFINPIMTGFFISLLRMSLPAMFMMIAIIPFALIPIKVIQLIGCVIVIFCSYFFKQFSDKLVDKIDHDKTAALIRFIAAIIIIVVEIILLTGHTLPQFS